MYKPLIRQKLLFFCLDFLLILFAFSASFFTRLGGFYRSDFPFSDYFENALLITPLWLVILIWGGKYSLQDKAEGDMLRIVSLASLAGSMLFVLVFFFRREIFFSRLIVVYIFLFGTLLGMISHFLEKKFEQWKVRNGKDIIRVLVIGANRAAEEMITKLRQQKSRHQPIAVLAPFGSAHKAISGVPVMGKLDALERVVDKERIREILLCDGVEQMMNLLSFAEGRFLDFRVSPEILGVFRENIVPEVIAKKPILSLQTSPLFGWGQFWKRLFDLTVSFSALVIFLPIWFLQKVWNVITGHGTVLQKEDRIGAGGREFGLFRYRNNSDALFRDLPNVLNVFKGEMSIVGPRPALPEEWKSLPAHFKRRMVLRPGMLGLWQLRKLQGRKDNFEEMCRDDLDYIHHWSFGRDMKIILLSKMAILKKLFRSS